MTLDFFHIAFIVCGIVFVAAELFVVYNKLQIQKLEIFDLSNMAKQSSIMFNNIMNDLLEIKGNVVKLESKIIAIDYAVKDANKTHQQKLQEIEEILKSKKDE